MVKLIENSPTLLKYKVNERTGIVLFVNTMLIIAGFIFVCVAFSQEDKSVMTILSGSLFGGLIAVYGFFLVPNVKICIFDKTRSKFILERQGLFRTKIIERDLNEIITVECDRRHYRVAGTGYGRIEGTNYQVNVVLLSSEYVHLTPESGSDRDDKQRMASDIKTFLNL
jgi:hypothetical protein